MLNLLAIVLISRRRHVARGVSFTMLYTTILGAVALLAEALGLYEGLDLFAGAFQAAFWQLVLVGVGIAWWVIARRIEKRVGEGAAGAAAAMWLGRVGLLIAAVGAVWWLIVIDIPAGITYISTTPRRRRCSRSRSWWSAVGSILAARVMWSQAAALHFQATAKQADRMVGWLYLSPNLVGLPGVLRLPAGVLAGHLVLPAGTA